MAHHNATNATGASASCPFKALGLQRTATKEEIEKAWRHKMLLVHPDRNHMSNATALTQEWVNVREQALKMLSLPTAITTTITSSSSHVQTSLKKKIVPKQQNQQQIPKDAKTCPPAATTSPYFNTHKGSSSRFFQTENNNTEKKNDAESLQKKAQAQQARYNEWINNMLKGIRKDCTLPTTSTSAHDVGKLAKDKKLIAKKSRNGNTHGGPWSMGSGTKKSLSIEERRAQYFARKQQM